MTFEVIIFIITKLKISKQYTFLYLDRVRRSLRVLSRV